MAPPPLPPPNARQSYPAPRAHSSSHAGLCPTKHSTKWQTSSLDVVSITKGRLSAHNCCTWRLNDSDALQNHHPKPTLQECSNVGVAFNRGCRICRQKHPARCQRVCIDGRGSIPCDCGLRGEAHLVGDAIAKSHAFVVIQPGTVLASAKLLVADAPVSVQRTLADIQCSMQK